MQTPSTAQATRPQTAPVAAAAPVAKTARRVRREMPFPELPSESNTPAFWFAVHQRDLAMADGLARFIRTEAFSQLDKPTRYAIYAGQKAQTDATTASLQSLIQVGGKHLLTKLGEQGGAA